jgi:hypothetical protein
MPIDPSAGRSGAVASDNPTYRGSWICYINGVEVPILGCDVRSGVWQMPTFQIHLIYSPLLEKFGDEDLVPVQVFYLDHWVDPARPAFRLLVDGEIVGYSRGLAHGQRTLSFQCVANIRMFEQLYFFYMTNVDDIVASTAPDVRSSGFTQEGLLYPYSLFHQGLLVTPDQVSSLRRARPNEITASADLAEEGETPATREIKTPYELAYNIVKGCIATTVPEERRALPAMNFFARHMRKTRFHNRWVRLPLLEDPDRLAREEGVFPIFKAARNDEALKAMQQHLATNLGNSGPVWSMLRQVLSMVYMEIGMISNPAAVRVALVPEGATDESGPLDGVIVDHLDPAAPLVRLQPPIEAPVAPPVRPETETPRSGTPAVALDVMREVFFELLRAAQTRDPDYQRSTIEAFLRRIETDPSAETPAELTERLSQAIVRNRADLVEAVLSRRDQLLQAYGTRTATEIAVSRTEALDTERRATVAAERARLDAEEARLRAELVASERVVSPRFGLDPARPLRLAQHFVKPQFMFGIAPHCNVVFPSMVERTGYDESYVNKPTRIYVNDSVMTRLLRADRNANSREFMLHALTVSFPEEADAVMHHRIDSGDGAAAPHATENGRNLLIWPREWYGGVNTARMELPSWFQMLRQFQNSRRETPEVPPNPAGTGAPAPPAPGRVAPPTPAAAPAAIRAAALQTAAPEPLGTDVARRGRLSATTGYQTTLATVPRMGTRLVLTGGVVREGVAFGYRDVVAPGAYLDPSRRLVTSLTLLAPLPPRADEAARRRDIRVRLVRLMALIEPELRRRPFFQNSNLTASQYRVAAFAMAFLSYQETGYLTQIYGWNLGNVRGVRPDGYWMAVPLPRNGRTVYSAFPAYRSLAEGVTALVDKLTQTGNFVRALRVMLGQRTLAQEGGAEGAALEAMAQRIPAAQAQYFQSLGARPDYFYLMLGFVGYFEAMDDVTGPPALRRASRSIRAVTVPPMAAQLRAALELSPIPQVIETVTPVTVPPFVAPENAALLTQPATATEARRARLTRENAARVAQPTGTAHAIGLAPSQGEPATRTVRTEAASTTTTSPASETEDAPTGPNDFQRLFRLYAQYEYLRQRYMQQQSATSLRFNPYLVPGFPCFVFDSMTTRGHITGYLTTVSHSLTVGVGATGAAMSTEISTIAARTLAEFVNDLRNDAERFVGRVTAAPAEPISEIREIIQDEELAETFYARLLFGSTTKARGQASFKFTEAMGYFDEVTGESIALQIDGDESVADYELRTRRESREATDGEDESTTAAPATAAETLPPEHRRDYGEVHRTDVSVNSIVQNLYMTGVNSNAEGTETAEDLRELLRLGEAVAAEVRREQVNLEREPNVPERPTLARATRRALELMRAQQARGQLTANFVDQAADRAATILSQLAELQRRHPLPAESPAVAGAAEAAAGTTRLVRTNLDPDREFSPRPGRYSEAFASYGKAMELCARPACSLEEYIRFLHAGMTVEALQAEGAVGGARTDFAYATPGEATSAVYYDRIFKLRPGPGTGPDRLDPPVPEELGHTTTHPITPTAVTRGVDADYPQTRADWDAILLEYVRRIRDRFSPET